MSGKNADVDRAIVAFGGTSFLYQSFTSFVVPFDNVIDTLAVTSHVIVEAPPMPVPTMSIPTAPPLAAKPFYENLPEVPPPPMARPIPAAAPSFVAPEAAVPAVAAVPAARPTYAVTFSDTPQPESVVMRMPEAEASPLPVPGKSDRRSLADMFRLLQERGESEVIPPPPVPATEIVPQPIEVGEKPRLFRRI